VRIPEKRLTVVILTNRNEGDVAALARKVLGSSRQVSPGATGRSLFSPLAA